MNKVFKNLFRPSVTPTSINFFQTAKTKTLFSRLFVLGSSTRMRNHRKLNLKFSLMKLIIHSFNFFDVRLNWGCWLNILKTLSIDNSKSKNTSCYWYFVHFQFLYRVPFSIPRKSISWWANWRKFFQSLHWTPIICLHGVQPSSTNAQIAKQTNFSTFKNKLDVAKLSIN